MISTPTDVDAYAAGFDEDPGYLDFARVGPLGAAVLDEQRACTELLRHARFGSLDYFETQGRRMGEAVASLTGFRPDQVVFQPNTSSGLMHTMFGFTGGVAFSPAEFPSVTFAAARAAESLQVLTPVRLESDYGRVTPGSIRDQLDSSSAAVAVSLVDFRTGYLADLDGIRQVIGDRLLIVDAIQGFGVVDVPWDAADVVVSGGQKWVRAGWGTGFLALSDRAAERLTPVFSGFSATAFAAMGEGMPLDEVVPPASGASAFEIAPPDPVAQAMLSTALEGIRGVGIEAINARIAATVGEIIDIADEFAVPVTSPRPESERAGIIVVEPAPDQLTALTAALFNHGITATRRQGHVRLSAHVSTGGETVRLLRDAFRSFASAIRV